MATAYLVHLFLASSSGKYLMPVCPASRPRSGGLQTPSNAQAFERGTEIVMGFELLKSGVESVAAKGV
jgi:hypothetical protein